MTLLVECIYILTAVSIVATKNFQEFDPILIKKDSLICSFLKHPSPKNRLKIIEEIKLYSDELKEALVWMELPRDPEVPVNRSTIDLENLVLKAPSKFLDVRITRSKVRKFKWDYVMIEDFLKARDRAAKFFKIAKKKGKQNSQYFTRYESDY
uniref:Uncharacterized protein n=1 Tax=Clastoptera arizonana TaxID=38151 RepID=A0A1B6CJT3_9HEMI